MQSQRADRLCIRRHAQSLCNIYHGERQNNLCFPTDYTRAFVCVALFSCMHDLTICKDQKTRMYNINRHP